jgi:hypothetical protein
VADEKANRNAEVADAVEKTWAIVRKVVTDAIEAGIITKELGGFDRLADVTGSVKYLDLIVADVARQTREAK